MTDFIGTGWKNSSSFPAGEAGYGIKIDNLADRDKYFARGQVKLHLDSFTYPIHVNTDKKSFWTPTCGELISKEIGRWMRSQSLIPWNGHPPKFSFHSISKSEFKVRLLSRR